MVYASFPYCPYHAYISFQDQSRSDKKAHDSGNNDNHLPYPKPWQPAQCNNHHKHIPMFSTPIPLLYRKGHIPWHDTPADSHNSDSSLWSSWLRTHVRNQNLSLLSQSCLPVRKQHDNQSYTRFHFHRKTRWEAFSPHSCHNVPALNWQYSH